MTMVTPIPSQSEYYRARDAGYFEGVEPPGRFGEWGIWNATRWATFQYAEGVMNAVEDATGTVIEDSERKVVHDELSGGTYDATREEMRIASERIEVFRRDRDAAEAEGYCRWCFPKRIRHRNGCTK